VPKTRRGERESRHARRGKKRKASRWATSLENHFGHGFQVGVRLYVLEANRYEASSVGSKIRIKASRIHGAEKDEDKVNMEPSGEEGHGGGGRSQGGHETDRLRGGSSQDGKSSGPDERTGGAQDASEQHDAAEGMVEGELEQGSGGQDSCDRARGEEERTGRGRENGLHDDKRLTMPGRLKVNVDHEDGTREGSDAENGSGSEAGELDDEAYARALQREFMGLRQGRTPRHGGDASELDSLGANGSIHNKRQRSAEENDDASGTPTSSRSKRLALAVTAV